MENDFVAWLCGRQRKLPGTIETGIGDDAAVLSPNSRIVVATDSIASGTHFLETESLTRVGRKALAVNLSDMAAMGAKPFAATVAFQIPSGFELSQVQEIYCGIEQIANEFAVSIVGGDTNRWDGGLVVSVTVIGTPYKNRLWKMDAAKVGDVILVSGDFGGSILGKHLDFQPRVKLAEYLTQHHNVSAATDVSDSLSTDLYGLAAASKLGFEIEIKHVPVSDAAHELAAGSGKTALEHALSDGEDFELIVCASELDASKMLGDPTLPTKLTRIGKMTAEQNFVTIDDAGQHRPLTIRGYEH